MGLDLWGALRRAFTLPKQYNSLADFLRSPAADPFRRRALAAVNLAFDRAGPAGCAQAVARAREAVDALARRAGLPLVERQLLGWALGDALEKYAAQGVYAVRMAACTDLAHLLGG